MNKLIMRHLSNKERGLLASGHGDCVVYTVHTLIASNLKNPSQYVAFGTVNFSWSFVCGIIRHYCRIWNSDFARDMLLRIPISFWKPRFFAYAPYQPHFHIASNPYIILTKTHHYYTYPLLYANHFYMNPLKFLSPRQISERIMLTGIG